MLLMLLISYFVFSFVLCIALFSTAYSCTQCLLYGIYSCFILYYITVNVCVNVTGNLDKFVFNALVLLL